MKPTPAKEAATDLLVSPAVLAERLGDPSWVTIDCRFNLQQPEAGPELYRQGHIPGACYAGLDRDLAGPRRPGLGRHPLPEPDALAARLRSFGIGPGVRVVAYDEGGGGFAVRLWWLLRWLGHREVALLDGGLAAWQRAGLPLATDVPAARQGLLVPQPGGMPVLTTAELEHALAAGQVLLLDLRAAERYAGQLEPIDPVAGHVPGAVSMPLAGNLAADGRFLPPDELRVRYQAVLGDRDPGAVVCMCGSGVTACHGIFALERAGLPGAALYAGSWSEWIRDPRRPVATGNDQGRG